MPRIQNPTGSIPISMWVDPSSSTERRRWHIQKKRLAIEGLCNNRIQPDYLMKWQVTEFLKFIKTLTDAQKGLRIYIAQFGNSKDDLLMPEGMDDQFTLVFSPATFAGSEVKYKDDKTYHIITEDKEKKIILTRNDATGDLRVKRYNHYSRKELSKLSDPNDEKFETKSVLHTYGQLAELYNLINVINTSTTLQPDVKFVWLRLTSYRETEPMPYKPFSKKVTVEFDLADEDGNIIDIVYTGERAIGLNNGGLCPPNTCYGNCLPEDDPEQGC